MFSSKLVLVTALSTWSLAALVTTDTDNNCAALPELEASVGHAQLQHSGKTHHAAPLQLNSACDWQCYLNRYPDLQEDLGSSAAAERHWHRVGSKEGRNCECDPNQAQHAQEENVVPANSKCLNFLHIPKNAGATMEEIREERKKVVDAAGPKEAGRYGFGWGESIMKYVECSSHHENTEKCDLDDGTGHQGHCSIFHTPPAFDSLIAHGYQGCETFCISRHPLSKAVSQHIFLGGQCDATSFAEKVKQVSEALASDPFNEDCHWVPQVHYTQHCQRILRFEHLAEDFNALMAEYSYPINLEEHHVTHGGSHCDLGEHPELLPAETLEWIETYYKKDFTDLDYNPRAAASTR